MLTREEELELATRFRKDDDLDAARTAGAVAPALRACTSRAATPATACPIGDLVQEGNVGLMKAVKRFDPDVGVRLVSFAVHWIRAEIHDYVLRNWRLVKIATTKAQRKLFFNLRKKEEPRLADRRRDAGGGAGPRRDRRGSHGDGAAPLGARPVVRPGAGCG